MIYWRFYEDQGMLRAAVTAYLDGGQMSGEQLKAIRDYLRQWMTGPWEGPDVEPLRKAVDSVVDRRSLDAWMEAAEKNSIDPF